MLTVGSLSVRARRNTLRDLSIWIHHVRAKLWSSTTEHHLSLFPALPGGDNDDRGGKGEKRCITSQKAIHLLISNPFIFLTSRTNYRICHNADFPQGNAHQDHTNIASSSSTSPFSPVKQSDSGLRDTHIRGEKLLCHF